MQQHRPRLGSRSTQNRQVRRLFFLFIFVCGEAKGKHYRHMVPPKGQRAKGARSSHQVAANPIDLIPFLLQSVNTREKWITQGTRENPWTQTGAPPTTSPSSSNLGLYRLRF